MPVMKSGRLRKMKRRYGDISNKYRRDSGRSGQMMALK